MLTPRNLQPRSWRWIWGTIHSTLCVLAKNLREVSFDLTRHPNNGCPHFPSECVGNWDTVPIFVYQDKGRYQPKYAAAVVKFQVLTTFIGQVAYANGPHQGAMSDTTLARLHRPQFTEKEFVLADLAYESVPNMLTPFKNKYGNHGMPLREQEYNRIHQFYRSRAEHTFARLKFWSLFSDRHRGDCLVMLEHAFMLWCSLLKIERAMRMPYPPI